MSDLYRSALSSRIAKLPLNPPDDGSEDNEEEEAANSIGDLPSSSSNMAPPSISRQRRKPKTPDSAYSPLPASSCFEQAVMVSVPTAGLDIRVYYTPPSTKLGNNGAGTVAILHPGAGYSGLTFALAAQEITRLTKGDLGVLAIDPRGHGKTSSHTKPASGVEDLSIDKIVRDFVELVKVLFPDANSAPTLLLTGHSMGGSVVTRACPLLQDAGYNIAGAAVLDVVEGFAIEALPHMNTLLNSRPSGFDSVEHGVEWHISNNQIHNLASARISVPATLVTNDTQRGPAVLWRTPLQDTALYWEGWFKGLSESFLSVRTARVLILAGTERLDKPLMIGQMQGKFQVVVLANVGHMLHEDDPARTAEVLVDFWKRNERVVIGSKVIKKVGEA